MKRISTMFLLLLCTMSAISQEQTIMLRDYISGVDTSGDEVYRCNYTYNDFGYITSKKTFRGYSQGLVLDTNPSNSYYEEYVFNEKNMPTRHSQYRCNSEGTKDAEIQRVVAKYGGQYSYCIFYYFSYNQSDNYPTLNLLYENGYDEWNNLCHYISYSNGYIQTKTEQKFVGAVKTTDTYSSDYDEEEVKKNRYYYVKATGASFNQNGYTTYHIEGKKKEHQTDADYSYYINATVSASLIDDFSKLDDLWVKMGNNSNALSASINRSAEHYSDDDWDIYIDTQTDSDGNILSGTMVKRWRNHLNGYLIFTPEKEYKDPQGPLQFLVSPSDDTRNYYLEYYTWQQDEWVLVRVNGAKEYYKEEGVVVVEFYDGLDYSGMPHCYNKRSYFYDDLKRIIRIQEERESGGNIIDYTINEYTYVDDTNLVRTVISPSRTDTYYYINHKYVDPETLSVSEILKKNVSNVVVKYYTPDGRQINVLQKGLNIVLMKDGTIKKIVVK